MHRRVACLLLIAVAVGCDSKGELAVCQGLFGQPASTTGLSTQQCGPSCRCGTAVDAQAFDTQRLAALRAKLLLDPPAAQADDPYALGDPPPIDPQQVCAVRFADAERVNYRLGDYTSESAAVAAGAVVTHFGRCGACSSLEDLAVYAGNSDLTQPVRACGVQGMSEGDQVNLDCLLALGFTPACAQIWLYNTKNTRNNCLVDCLLELESPYHLEDGSLNACLRCDEDKSGPVFKAFAGRTRRNSGLATAICRPCESVRAVAHRYD